jgi:hypothetical protein
MNFPHRVPGTSLRAVTVGVRLQIRFKDRLDHQLGSGLHNPVPNSRHGQHELHLTTAHIWVGLRSATPTIHFEASVSEF